MKHYLGEVWTENLANSDAQAKTLAALVADDIVEVKGTIQVGLGHGEAPAVLIVALPDGANPDELLPPGVAFNEVGFMAAPVQEDHGIESDPGEGPA